MQKHIKPETSNRFAQMQIKIIRVESFNEIQDFQEEVNTFLADIPLERLLATSFSHPEDMMGSKRPTFYAEYLK
ncbi:hypothetical protein [Carnobacterium sp. TMP28]|uniref:hypothetical protein n=1 Tax=Carnobacterium sp. TMP28 TaxID=3397060 RepID=UPI0039E1787E